MNEVLLLFFNWYAIFKIVICFDTCIYFYDKSFKTRNYFQFCFIGMHLMKDYFLFVIRNLQKKTKRS